MIDNETEKQLHERSSRGESLTSTEQAQLAAWYAAQDLTEADLLHPLVIEVDLPLLQRQVDVASTQLMAITERIQQVAAENNALRQEITRLQQQLASQKQPV